MASMNPFDFFSSIDFKSYLGNLSSLGMLAVALFGGGVIVFLLFRWKKKKVSGVEKEIRWWEEIHGHLVPVRVDSAEEITIPGTNLRVFFIKDKNMWLPRFSRGVTANTFFVAITKNKELVNFTLKTITESRDKADLAFDHTDMRWAAENLREFVKRNYKDKAISWWREYSGIISVVIFVIIMTASLVTIIYFLRGVIHDISTVSNSLAEAIDKINACAPGSGLVISK